MSDESRPVEETTGTQVEETTGAQEAGSAARPSGRASSDVGTLPAIALAIPVYGIAVMVAREMPPDIRAILLERGWVCHAIMMLASLALTILFLKAMALRAQRAAFALEVLPGGERTIGPRNVDAVLAHAERVRVARAEGRARPSFLIERVVRVLEHYAARRDAAEAAAVNNSEADADAASSASSFSVVKILVWAIPILGFIGTVIGIGDAVGGFSRSLVGAGQLDTIKGALGDVTTGLAVAFDTTLVALVASILVMMPTSWLQKAEEGLAADVDDFVVSHVLKRLAGREEAPAQAVVAPVAVVAPAPAPAESVTADEVRKLLADAMAPPLAAMLCAHGKLMDRLVEDRAAVAASQAAVHEQVAASQAAMREQVAASQAAVQAHLAAFGAAAAKVAPALEAAASQLAVAVGSLERTGAAAERDRVVLAEQRASLEEHRATLARQLVQVLAAGLGASAMNDVATAPGRGAGGALGVNGIHGTNGANGAHAG